MSGIYGYFDQPWQTDPAYDPGLEVKCPVCYQPLTAFPTGSAHLLKTISLMVPEDARSYFYRAHKGCYDSLNEYQKRDVDSALIDAHCRHRGADPSPARTGAGAMTQAWTVKPAVPGLYLALPIGLSVPVVVVLERLDGEHMVCLKDGELRRFNEFRLWYNLRDVPAPPAAPD